MRVEKDRMNILLINPTKLIEPPIGLLYIASVLERGGHNVSISEAPVSERASLAELECHVIAAMNKTSPDLVGITCTSPDSKSVKHICALLRKKWPKVKLVAGGIHPTTMPKEVLLWGADIVIRGEGEETIVDLIKYFQEGGDLKTIPGIAFLKDGEAVITRDRAVMECIDKLPLPAYHLLDKNRFTKRNYSIRGKWLRCVAIITSRGCFGRCTFCASDKVHKRIMRWMSMERVMEEIEYFIKQYHIEGLYISDDSFTINKSRVFEFCEELRRRKIRLSWACQSRVGGLSEDMLKTMKDSGLIQVEFGVESGSQKVLNMLRKGIKVEDTVREFELCHKHGVRALANIMIGIPGETMDDINQTRILVNRIKPHFTAVFFCTPFPGTELYDCVVREGLMRPGQEIDWRMITEPMLSTTVPKEELIRMYDLLQKDNIGFLREYMKDINFLSDMAHWIMRQPILMSKLAYLYINGRLCDAQNLFLHIFRKYHLNT